MQPAAIKGPPGFVRVDGGGLDEVGMAVLDISHGAESQKLRHLGRVHGLGELLQWG